MDTLAQLKTLLLGKYAIEREIGRGGMATVYLARDQRHDRPVALKVLSPDLGAVLGVERFLAEIRITANLQHPNLLPLYDSGEAEGLLFYFMPYVDGESLRAKLLREKQLPIDEAVHIAKAVASAIGYAHRHGVVHRDLKPENILLHDGRPLVADFGIALAVSKAGGERITQTGMSLGTPQYMSPEQATGDRPIDGRTDIYSLGAVLYEMLTGDPPHTASTAQALIAKIVSDVPPSTRTTRPHVPAQIDMAVARALEKLPADRWHTVEEFAEALEADRGVVLPAGARTPRTFAPAPSHTEHRRFGRRLRLAAALSLAVVVVATGVLWRLYSRGSDAQSVSFVLEPPSSEAGRTSIGNVAVSPDGKILAFVVASDSASSVYVRRIDEATSRRVQGTEGALFVSFSPSGRWLSVATSDRRLVKTAVDGSSAITLADTAWVWGGATWENEQSLILYGSGLRRISATGGAIRQVTKPRSPPWRQGFAVVAHDGETVVFMDGGPGFTEDDFLAIGSLKTGQYHTTSLLLNRPIGIVDGHIVYVTATGAMMAVAFDARAQRITGDPVRVMEGLLFDVSTAVMSPNGTLVHRRGRWTNHLVLETPDRRTVTLSNVEGHLNWLTSPRFSPDGRRIAAAVQAPRGDTLTSDIWIFDIATRAFSRVSSVGNVNGPEWTPDGRNLVFKSWFFRKAALWLQSADGARPREAVLTFPDGQQPGSATVTPDGRGVIFCGNNFRPGTMDLGFVGFEGQRKPQLIDTSRVCGGRVSVSPDGKWLAYATNDGQGSNVYVGPYKRSGARYRISSNGGLAALWSRDGKRLYYVQPDAADGSGSLFAAQLEVNATGVKVVRQERVTSIAAGSYYDVGPDGSVLRLEPTDGGVQVVVTTNWLPQLRAKLK